MDWPTAEQVQLVAAGAAIGALVWSAGTWLMFQVWHNRLPRSGEPAVFVNSLLPGKVENGAILQIAIRNGQSRTVWIDNLKPISRAHGRINPIILDDLQDADGPIDLAASAALSIGIGRRLDPDETFTLVAWVGGLEWPIQKGTLELAWSPYGPAARQNKLVVHCKF